MFLKSLMITNFRNYETLSLEFHPGINIIYGNNAQGKTNLLESIYVLGLTKSHRSFIDHNLIKDGKQISKIKGKIEENKIVTSLEITLDYKGKNYKIDNQDVKKVSDYISNMNIIIFYPEDLELIKNSPIIRRRYLNLELSQLDRHYYTLLHDYNRLLKMRNECLKKLQKGEEVDLAYFEILNQYYVEKSIKIYRMRNKYITRLNEYCGKIYKDITGTDDFTLIYKPYYEINSYDEKSLKEILSQKIKNMFETEKKLGSTLVGPHRDDFLFQIDKQDLKQYGSQGQQRAAILAIKLAEIELFKKYKGNNPILLLDDVFSELDDKKKNNLLHYIDSDIQTVITTTDLKNIKKSILKKSKLIKIEHAQVIKTEEVEKDGRK